MTPFAREDEIVLTPNDVQHLQGVVNDLDDLLSLVTGQTNGSDPAVMPYRRVCWIGAVLSKDGTGSSFRDGFQARTRIRVGGELWDLTLRKRKSNLPQGDATYWLTAGIPALGEVTCRWYDNGALGGAHQRGWKDTGHRTAKRAWDAMIDEARRIQAEVSVAVAAALPTTAVG